MQKKWIFKTLPDINIIQELSKSINIDKNLATLLVQRQIHNFDNAKDFFRPSLGKHLYNPFLMKDMDIAVKYLNQTISKKEKILIYGDYDVDGTTSVALVYSFLSKFYKNLDYYIPDRYEEGYGISKQAIDWAKQEDFKLIIALDCGIKAHDLVDYAKGLGIYFIICDHHLPSESVPKAVAVLDPKQKECTYPYKELSGCGVGFKFMEAFAEKNNIPKENLFDFLDLLVVSIASDLVHITRENRVLAYFGLKKINENPNIGLNALTQLYNSQKKHLNIRDIVFGIGPKINAVGRLGNANEAVKLLVEKDKNEAKKQAEIINSINTQRQNIDAQATDEALEMIAENEKEGKESKSTVLFKKGWHKGILGIVASRCIETYYRPTIIFGEYKGVLTGSGRSIRGFNLYEAIRECSDLLENFGGHQQAAGMTIKEENLKKFQERFEKITKEKLNGKKHIPPIFIDTKLNLEQITPKFFRILKQFAPFGPENMRPVFLSENLELNHLQVLKDKHLRFEVKQENSDKYFVVLAFGMADFHAKIQRAKRINLAYTIEENTFLGKTNLQLRAKDIQVL